MNATINNTYLKGIANNDLSVLKQIYQQSLPEVIKYVKKNSGNAEDAKDVFQEGIMVVYRKVKTGTLELTTDFHVFLYQVCRRIWLKKLKKSWNKEVTFDDLGEFVYDEDIEASLLKSKKWALFNQKFPLLAEECRKVLQMLFNGKSGKDIAASMGYTLDYAKRKKYKCKLALTDLIRKDPEYLNLSI